MNGIERAARIVTAPRAGGFNSTSQRSPPAAPVPPGPVRRSVESSRRAATVPMAGGSSDHSIGSSTGSENCTTIESRSDAAGWHSNVTASVSRSSRTVSRTWVRASRGGRRRTSRAGRDAARKPAHSRARAAPSSISMANRPSGPTAWKSAWAGPAGTGRSGDDDCSSGNSTVVSGLLRRSSSAERSDSPSRRTMSISAVEKSSPSAMPARCPVIRSPRLRAGVTAAIRPIRSTSPRVSRSTFQSRPAAGSSALRRRGASASSAGVGSVMASTESMNQPGVMRAVRSKASPRCTRTSHVARPTTTPGDRSTVVTRTTSRAAVRGSSDSVTIAPGDCSSTNSRDGQTPGAAPSCSLPACDSTAWAVFRSAVIVAAAAGSGHREATSGGTTRHRSSSIDDSVSDGAVWMAMPPPAQASAGARSSGSGAACSPIGATALITIGVRSPMQRGGMSIRIAVPSSTTLHDTSSKASSNA